MNDVEHDLRELFAEKVREAGTAPPAPPAMLRRGRRRQMGTVAAAVSAFTAAALVVVVASAEIRSATPAPATPAIGAAEPGGLEERTATIQDFTVTAPAGWPLIDWWPAAQHHWAAEPGQAPSAGISTTANPADATIPDVVPVLQVSNYDPGLDATIRCGSGGAFGADHALVFVGIDAAAWSAGGPLPPAWPVPLEDPDTAAGGPCGPGSYARFSIDGVPYFAFVRFGPEVANDVRQQVLDTFAAMQVSNASPAVSVGLTPGYVVAAGTLDGEAWRVELGTPSPALAGTTVSPASTARPVWVTVITGSEDARVRAPLTPAPMLATTAGIRGPMMIPIGSQGVIVGAVTPDADTVEYVAPDATPVDLALVPVPESLGSAGGEAVPILDRMFWGLGDTRGGEIVQRAADGTEVLRQQILLVDTEADGVPAAGTNELAYEIPDGGPITADGTFQDHAWKVEVLFYKDGLRLTIDGTPEDLGVLGLNEPLMRSIGRDGYGALVLVLTDTAIGHVAVSSEGSWEGRWMPASTGDGAEARLWVIEVPGAGAGTLALDGQPSGAVTWP